MKKHGRVSAIYFFMFLTGMIYSGIVMDTKPDGLYRQAMEKYGYQLSNRQLYSPLFREDITETVMEEPVEKTIYLTFDDGPTERTAEILELLAKYEIKATFFVVKTKDEYVQYMQRAAEEGHTIGVHSASHKYREIYSSVEAYLADFNRCHEYIKTATGIRPEIFRFPGGSVNNYNAGTRKAIVEEMTRRGYVYFDWNVESGDSASNMSSDTIYNNVVNGCKGRKRRVIIFHDSQGKQSTVRALERLIPKFKEEGWVFKPLTNEVKPMIFKMK